MKKLKISLGIILFMAFIILLFPMKSYAIDFWSGYQGRNGNTIYRGVWGIYKSIVNGRESWLDSGCWYFNGDNSTGNYVGEANISWAEQVNLTGGAPLINSRYAFCSGHRMDGAGGNSSNKY